ncbi:MAG: N-6 DNA methylase [Opitutaceae bacterium]
MPIPASILERVETFGRNFESYLHPDYKEQRLREEFLNPFFQALGWDTANASGYAEAYKDVVLEDSLKISGVSATAPDYSFRIGGTRKFFVEAKKPSVRIKDDPAPAAQLRRYSYSAKLSLGIVTDFHEFAIYATRQRPRENDKASASRVFYCTFDQYAEKWDEIAAIFSRESVLKGSFDKYAATNKGKRGTSEFDADFLADMEAWRKSLAENLALRNRALTQRDLNFAVQRILDRVIFLRSAEDRGIEPYGQLLGLTAGGKIYPRLCEVFERADFRYNSGLFHFTSEKGREESPDKLTLSLSLDDAVLREIVGALYWPKSPYAFAVIPADILGHIYEQFLGKVIHLTPEHRARVEEKPEVRKAGGVYYTPTYIVNYIVAQTVGPLVAGKTPKQVERLTVLDPACGSGSFLLGAYEFLLAWHLDYYVTHDPAAWAKKKQPPIYETSPNAHGVGRGSGNWLLTTAERKRILVNNLYGVDIDAQAVEVTKLSLLLKVLEGEARELQGKQLDFHRVLPDLGNNIKCGNSLIGSDFYAQADLPEFDDEARIKINAFDWKHEFKPIMDAGGFDAVIGNPPYVLLQILEQPEVFAYTSARYRVARYKIDTYHLFIERGLTLTKEGGRFGLIVPNTFLRNKHARELRQLILDASEPDVLRLFFYNVFHGASVDTAVFLATRTARPSAAKEVVIIKSTREESVGSEFRQGVKVWQSHPTRDFEIAGAPSDDRLLARIENACDRLGTFATAYFGIQTHDRRRFVADERRIGYVPVIDGVHIGRYSLKRGTEFADVSAPAVKSGGKKTVYAKRRIGVRQIGATPVATMIPSGLYTLNTIYNVFFVRESPLKLEAILGLLSSALIRWYWTCRFFDQKKTFPKVKKAAILGIPIPQKFETKIHDALVAHVERMLKLHTDLAAAKSPDQQTRLQRDIAATDRAIDQLVYQLYGLTPDEIALVEKATAPTASSAAEADEPSPLPEPAPEAYAQAETDAAHHYFTAKEDPPASTP